MDSLNYIQADLLKSAQNKPSIFEAASRTKMSTKLLSAIQHGSDDEALAEQLSKLLSCSDQSYDLDYLYHQDPVNGTLLHLAVRKNLPTVARLLINKGADPNARDVSGDKCCPLHYAASMCHHRVVQVLLEGGANPNATRGKFGSSSLHILIEGNLHNTKEEDFRKCLKNLLDNENIDIEIQDKDKETPLVLACVKGCKFMVQHLILKGASIAYINNNVPEINQIQTIFNEILASIEADPDLSEIRRNNLQSIPQHFHGELKGAMNNSDLKRFKCVLSDMDKDPSKENKLKILDSDEDQGKTLLQYACDNGYLDFVDELLKQGADELKFDKTNKYSPILYATEKGYENIVKLLTSAMFRNKTLGIGLQQTDKSGETVLHKVVKQEYQSDEANYLECLKILLNHKSYLNIVIDAKDNSGNTALHYSAVLNDQNFGRLLLINGAHFGIKNNQDKLAIANIQASILRHGLNHCIELPDTNKKGSTSVHDFEIRLNYRQLIGHKNSETACIKFLSRSDAHCHLLCHPIINTFLSLKWQKIQKYYLFNFFIYLFYLVLLTTYILVYHHKYHEQDYNSSESNSTSESATKSAEDLNYPAGQIILQILIGFITLCFGIKEAVQLFISWRSYITSFKNILEMAIVILTFILLFLRLEPLDQQHISAWLILFSWTNFILILGCHPKLAIYITMFRKVSRNFIKFIILFSCMILAFSFSFYLVFQFDENFMTIPQTILRTIVMTTGELEFTDLPFQTFPNASQILFLLFVLFIILVLMNFITGLAVSDIHMIQQEAEIYSYRSQVDLISHLESVFMINTLSSPKYTSGMKSSTVRTFLKSLLMFPSCLKSEKIQIFPNQSISKRITLGQIWRACLGVLPIHQRKVFCTCKSSHAFSVEQAQIDAAMAVLMAEEDVTERLLQMEEHVAQRFDKIDKRLMNIEKAIGNIAE
ncbi:unnamed protein product, partial [Meganyctiphanes norvegica]